MLFLEYFVKYILIIAPPLLVAWVAFGKGAVWVQNIFSYNSSVYYIRLIACVVLAVLIISLIKIFIVPSDMLQYYSAWR